MSWHVATHTRKGIETGNYKLTLTGNTRCNSHPQGYWNMPSEQLFIPCTCCNSHPQGYWNLFHPSDTPLTIRCNSHPQGYWNHLLPFACCCPQLQLTPARVLKLTPSPRPLPLFLVATHTRKGIETYISLYCLTVWYVATHTRKGIETWRRFGYGLL